MHPDDVGSAAESFREVMSAGDAVVRSVLRVRHGGDGRWHTYETLATNRLDDPDVNAIIVNFRDVNAMAPVAERV